MYVLARMAFFIGDEKSKKGDQIIDVAGCKLMQMIRIPEYSRPGVTGTVHPHQHQATPLITPPTNHVAHCAPMLPFLTPMLLLQCFMVADSCYERH